MSDGNPLVADRVDTTSAFAGAFLLQDGEDLANAISSGDWAAGALAVTSTALDTVGAIIDPIGTLIANGLGWVLDHIEPLKSWFNDFTGDAAEVASFSGTWGNTSGYIAQLADGYQGMLSQLDDMAGEGIDAYLGYASAVIANLRAAGEWSNAIAVGLQIASTLVQAVHDIVRDVLSQLVGSAISAAATTACTIGFGAPVAMAQFGTKVAGLVAKVSRVITKVLDALAQLLRRLEPLIRNISEVYSKFIAFIKRVADRVYSTVRRGSDGSHGSPDQPPSAETPGNSESGRDPDDDWGFGSESDLRPDLSNPGGHDRPYRPRVGDTDRGAGQWIESPRTATSRGMPFQIEHSGVAPSDSGRVMEYRMDSATGGKPVDFDNFTHRGDPPVDTFQDFKGDYSILEQPWMKKPEQDKAINKWSNKLSGSWFLSPRRSMGLRVSLSGSSRTNWLRICFERPCAM